MVPPPPPHALVVPSHGLGHINGCLLLSRALLSVGFSVSFAYLSSDFRLLSQKNRLPHLPSDHISFLVLEDGKNSTSFDPQTTFLVTPDMIQNLRKLILQLQGESHRVTCLVSDAFSPWIQDVADQVGLPRVEYWTSNAMSMHMVCNAGLLHDKSVLPERGSPREWRRVTPLIIEIPGLTPFPSERYPAELRFGEKTSPVVKFCREVAESSNRAERILIHTMEELEEEAFRACEAVGKKAYAIGPLLHYSAKKEGEGRKAKNGDEEDAKKCRSDGEKVEADCMAWLDGQEEGSVLYVAFGSQGKLLEEDLQELAKGLEASGVPFLWALRPEIKPDGFVRTNVNQGLIVDWAPQTDVLSHPSVGGFLSHCGWNSTLESICAGVPLICCPLGAEQRSNSEYISDFWKIGIELERTPSSGLHSSFVESSVKCLMQEDVGRYIRQRAEDLMHLAQQTSQEGGRSMSNLHTFYEDMKALCS